jgi:hypothetical protein
MAARPAEVSRPANRRGRRNASTATSAPTPSSQARVCNPKYAHVEIVRVCHTDSANETATTAAKAIATPRRRPAA